MDQRGTFRGMPAPGPFHCLGCRSFVTGTPSGHCPRCGYVPPVALALPETAHAHGSFYAGLAALAILAFVPGCCSRRG